MLLFGVLRSAAHEQKPPEDLEEGDSLDQRTHPEWETGPEKMQPVMRRAEGCRDQERPLLTNLRVGKKGSEQMAQGHRELCCSQTRGLILRCCLRGTVMTAVTYSPGTIPKSLSTTYKPRVPQRPRLRGPEEALGLPE